MGLDQYLFRRPKTQRAKISWELEERGEIDEKYDNNGEKVETLRQEVVMYWRKAYILNDFMCSLLSVENCEDVDVSKETLIEFKTLLEDYKDRTDFEEADKQYEYYYEVDYEEWVDKLEKIIGGTDWDNEVVIYHIWY
jgi:hypothetical protein